jgi:hypothetical protein
MHGEEIEAYRNRWQLHDCAAAERFQTEFSVSISGAMDPLASAKVRSVSGSTKSSDEIRARLGRAHGVLGRWRFDHTMDAAGGGGVGIGMDTFQACMSDLGAPMTVDETREMWRGLGRGETDTCSADDLKAAIATSLPPEHSRQVNLAWDAVSGGATEVPVAELMARADVAAAAACVKGTDAAALRRFLGRELGDGVDKGVWVATHANMATCTGSTQHWKAFVVALWRIDAAAGKTQLVLVQYADGHRSMVRVPCDGLVPEGDTAAVLKFLGSDATSVSFDF